MHFVSDEVAKFNAARSDGEEQQKRSTIVTSNS